MEHTVVTPTAGSHQWMQPVQSCRTYSQALSVTLPQHHSKLTQCQTSNVLVAVYCTCLQDRSIDRVFTCVYLPITLSLVGLVSRFPRILWNSRTRILSGYSLFTLCTAVIPVVSWSAS
jgi:hypothetical protein